MDDKIYSTSNVHKTKNTWIIDKKISRYVAALLENNKNFVHQLHWSTKTTIKTKNLEWNVKQTNKLEVSKLGLNINK